MLYHSLLTSVSGGLVSSFQQNIEGKVEAKHFKKCKNERIKIICCCLEKKHLESSVF